MLASETEGADGPSTGIYCACSDVTRGVLLLFCRRTLSSNHSNLSRFSKPPTLASLSAEREVMLLKFYYQVAKTRVIIAKVSSYCSNVC